MKFENPSILFSLLLLVIPIIIHLVHWKKFKKQIFSNVNFLQDLEIKSRKSRHLKELLVLLMRLIALTALILAFAKPYKASQAQDEHITKSKSIIYLDNSLSLDALPQNTTLWQDYLQDLQLHLDPKATYTLLTNDHIYRNISHKNISHILQQIHLSGTITNHHLILNKINYLLGKQPQNATILYCSDLQNVYHEKLNDTLFPSRNHYYFISHNYPKLKNISLDSLWQTAHTKEDKEFMLKVSANDHDLKTPISIRQKNEVLWRGFLDFKDSLKQNIKISLSAKKALAAKIEINDKGFQFDNKLFFTRQQSEEIPILVIGNQLPLYLKKIYTHDAFKTDSIPLNKLSTNMLDNYDLVILKNFKISPAYAGILKKYLDNYGNLLILPNDNQAENLQNLLQNLTVNTQVKIDTSQVFLNKINYDQPLFKGVFTKRVYNFTYPFVKQHYHFSKTGDWLYQLSDQSPFAQVFNRKGKIFIINAPLNPSNTNFEQAAALIVPLFYQIGKARQYHSKLYYIIGQKNQWSIKTQTKPDAMLHISRADHSFIPYQVSRYNSIKITTHHRPQQAGIYDITYLGHKIGRVAYNDNRKEHDLRFLNLPKLQNIKHLESVKSFVSQQQVYFKSKKLWPWLLGLALLALLIEMLLIRYWK